MHWSSMNILKHKQIANTQVENNDESATNGNYMHHRTDRQISVLGLMDAPGM